MTTRAQLEQRLAELGADLTERQAFQSEILLGGGETWSLGLQIRQLTDERQALADAIATLEAEIRGKEALLPQLSETRARTITLKAAHVALERARDARRAVGVALRRFVCDEFPSLAHENR